MANEEKKSRPKTDTAQTADRLKNPMTTLGLALQRMEAAQTEEERRCFLEMAKRGQKELTRVVEEVLDAARTEQKEQGG